MRRAALTAPPAGYVRIGRLGRSFKLDGGVRLLIEAELDDEELTTLLDSSPRLFISGLGESRLRAWDTRTGSLVVHVEGVRDRTVARSLVNAGVWAEESDLPEGLGEAIAAPTTEESLAGMPVIVDGATRGEVASVFLNEVNPFVEVRLADGNAALVPLTAPYVEIAEDALVLTDPPDGLLG